MIHCDSESDFADRQIRDPRHECCTLALFLLPPGTKYHQDSIQVPDGKGKGNRSDVGAKASEVKIILYLKYRRFIHIIPNTINTIRDENLHQICPPRSSF